MQSRYLYQSNENFDCLPYGGSRRDCLWGGHYERIMSKCPLSLHYQTPQQLREKFSSERSRAGEVCFPAEAPAWKTRTTECTCLKDHAALTMALHPLPKPTGHPRGWRRLTTEPPSMDVLKSAAQAIVDSWKGPQPITGKELRDALEAKFMRSLPFGRKFKFKEWIEDMG